MTRNQDLNVLHVNNAKAFAAGVDARVVTGDTLIFDFIYFLHPVRGSRLFQPVVLHGCVWYWDATTSTCTYQLTCATIPRAHRALV